MSRQSGRARGPATAARGKAAVGNRAKITDWESAIFLVAAILWPALYAYYTQQIWEDFFITFRHSQNLVEGHGLVYQPGERVHGFTSPIGVLLPAALLKVATWFGSTGYEGPLLIFRAMGTLAYAGGGWFILRAMQREPECGWASRWLFAALYLLDVKAVGFSVNGMETGFMLLFVGWSFLLLMSRGPWRWLPCGLAWAGLMWTRPDGCFYIAALAVAGLAVDWNRRRERIWSLLKMGLVCAVVYLPWFAWAWSYYGSPVPHTVMVKQHAPSPLEVQTFPLSLITGARLNFAPVYDQSESWPVWLYRAEWLLSVVALFYWAIPGRDRLGRAASCYFLLVTLMRVTAQIFPWYLPPGSMLAWVVIARASERLGTYAIAAWRGKAWPKLAAVAGAAIVFAALYAGVVVSVGGTRQAQVFQALIEDGLRRPIGEWLATRVRPGERVFLECLGYIGYFSRAKMLDHPGLCSPEVAKLSAKKLLIHEEIAALDPEWLVLRINELEAAKQDPTFAERYELVHALDHWELITRVAGRDHGLPFLINDSKFAVLHRKPKS